MSWKIEIDNQKCFYRFSIDGILCCGHGDCKPPYTDKPCTEAACPLRAKEEGDG